MTVCLVFSRDSYSMKQSVPTDTAMLRADQTLCPSTEAVPPVCVGLGVPLAVGLGCEPGTVGCGVSASGTTQIVFGDGPWRQASFVGGKDVLK